MRAELERILAFPDMAASGQMSAFLRFVVEEALAGHESRIKERTVAIGALGRDDRFDPRLDAIVRIVAGKLRRTMQRYYLSDGASSDLRIVIPKGTYCPLFVAGGEGVPAAEPDLRVPAVQVLRTKLHPPPPPPDLVRREAVLAQLERHRHLPLTLVSAPAGYGKSTLVATWLEETESPGAWLSLDEEDNDLRLLLAGLVAAVRTVAPDAVEAAEALLGAPDLPPVSVLGRSLLNDLAAVEDPFILALDDCHLVQDTAFHGLLEELLRHPLRNMHLVLMTREDPPLALARLRGLGQMNEVGAFDLRFTPAETAEFVARILGKALDEAKTEALAEQLEGWPAGLRLAAHSLGRAGDPSHVLTRKGGSLESVAGYLVAEVLARESPSVRGSLLRTAALERFCAPLIDALIERDDSDIDGARFLEWLKRRNLFVVSLDAEGRWCRYHHLFGQLLRNELAQSLGPKEIAELHSRASRWFAGEGLVDEAISHALAAGDAAAALRLVEETRQAAHNNDEWYALQRRLAMLPDEAREASPKALLDGAWVLYHQFRVPAIPAVLDKVEPLLAGGASADPLLGEVEFFRGYCTYFQGDGAGALHHLERAVQHIPEEHHEIRGQAEILLCLATQMEGEREKAVQMLNDLLYTGESPQAVRATRLLATLAYIHTIAGDAAAASRASRRLHEVAEGSGYAYARSWSDYLQGVVDMGHNEMASAIDHLSQAVDDRYILHTRASTDAMVALALAYQATGRPQEADAMLALLAEYAHTKRDPACLVIAESSRARLALVRGAEQSAVRWARAASPPPPEVMVWWFEIPTLTHCRALLARDSGSGLRELVGRLGEHLKANEAVHNIRQQIDILSLLALAHHKQGQSAGALAALSRAVDLAAPGGWIWPFVEPGQPMAELLRLLPAQRGRVHFVANILAALERVQQDAPAALPTVSADRPRLTEREAAVLPLLARGLSTKQIASELGISVSAAGGRCRSICRKLEAHTRADAVTRARDLGLLPPD